MENITERKRKKPAVRRRAGIESRKRKMALPQVKRGRMNRRKKERRGDIEEEIEWG